MKNGLVLEGGGMRGIYTAGVLDYFLEQNLVFPNIYAVSAGVFNAVNYASNQKERTKNIYLKYANDPRYVSLNNFIKTGSFFGWDFIFRVLSDVLEPFDYKKYQENNLSITVVASNINKGIAFYKKVEDIEKDMPYMIASASLPIISKIVTINKEEFLDGGIFDPIPYNKALSDNMDKLVCVLTRDEGYRKKKMKISLYQVKFRKYPLLVEALRNRHTKYNETLDDLKEKEKEKKVFVIRPSKEIDFKRFEKNVDNLKWLYELGYNDAKNSFNDLEKYLEK